MRNKDILGILLIVGAFLFACRFGQPYALPVESVSTLQNTQLPPPDITATTENPISATSTFPPETTVAPLNLIPPTAIFPFTSTIEIRQWHNLQIPRTGHTATLLPNGNILLVGGSLEPDDFVADE